MTTVESAEPVTQIHNVYFLRQLGSPPGNFVMEGKPTRLYRSEDQVFAVVDDNLAWRWQYEEVIAPLHHVLGQVVGGLVTDSSDPSAGGGVSIKLSNDEATTGLESIGYTSQLGEFLDGLADNVPLRIWDPIEKQMTAVIATVQYEQLSAEVDIPVGAQLKEHITNLARSAFLDVLGGRDFLLNYLGLRVWPDGLVNARRL